MVVERFEKARAQLLRISEVICIRTVLLPERNRFIRLSTVPPPLHKPLHQRNELSPRGACSDGDDGASEDEDDDDNDDVGKELLLRRWQGR